MRTRQDMLDELSSDWVSSAADMAIHDYTSLHMWLQPVFTKVIEEEYPDDESLAQYYEAQFGEAP